MTREAKLMSGIILITVPGIQYGGYFLLTSLMNKSSGYMDNPLRQRTDTQRVNRMKYLYHNVVLRKIRFSRTWNKGGACLIGFCSKP